jgi:hypothetical protein
VRPFFCFSNTNPVGAAEGCDLLILIFKKQDQKIAAFGSSYRIFAIFVSGLNK